MEHSGGLSPRGAGGRRGRKPSRGGYCAWSVQGGTQGGRDGGLLFCNVLDAATVMVVSQGGRGKEENEATGRWEVHLVTVNFFLINLYIHSPPDYLRNVSYIILYKIKIFSEFST